jgi:hypothetical protein
MMQMAIELPKSKSANPNPFSVSFVFFFFLQVNDQDHHEALEDDIASLELVFFSFSLM